MNPLEIKKSDYAMTFWAGGVSPLATDACVKMYTALDPLCVLWNGMYKQYFPVTKLALAAQEGLLLYGNVEAFADYVAKMKELRTKIVNFYEQHIQAQKSLTKILVQDFFDVCTQMWREYSKMDFEYVDATYPLKDANEAIAKNLAIFSVVKDEMRSFINRMLFEKEAYLKEITRIMGEQFGFSAQDLERCTLEELLSLFDGAKLDLERLRYREHAFVIWVHGGITRTIEGAEAEAIAKQLEDTFEATDVIRGKTANPGVARGRVKVITLDYSDFEKLNRVMATMESGQILVSETTAPELMVACKKAAAIVTEIGGLMSHAAIVSREMHIPCIVGTKHATKVLKDGDEVEVDATEGTVRIMKKH